jgi:hypothetical protein
MLYVDFILADNETPKKPFETMRRSSLLFSKSGNALFLYALAMIPFFIVLSVMTSSDKNSSYSLTKSTSSGSGVLIGSLIISSFVTNIISIIISVGITDIYNEAKEKLDGPAPTAPVQQPVQAFAAPQPVPAQVTNTFSDGHFMNTPVQPQAHPLDQVAQETPQPQQPQMQEYPTTPQQPTQPQPPQFQPPQV